MSCTSFYRLSFEIVRIIFMSLFSSFQIMADNEYFVVVIPDILSLRRRFRLS